jgi:hypothetical protein
MANAQIGGSISGIGGRGTGLRSSGGLRSGVGLRSNRVANPAPSLTPHQVFNPRGSLSAGQVSNPSPSLFRPRSGAALSPGSASSLRHGVTSGNSARRNTTSRSDPPRSVVGRAGEQKKLETGDDRNSRLELDEIRELPVIEPNLEADVKARLLTELVQANTHLQRAIERFHHAGKWQTYLDIPVGQRTSSNDLRVIQSRFDTVARLEKYKPLASLAIFQRTRDQLSNYLARFGDDSQ